mmetsp:Transcript_16521/g.16628  ORF Transcript_16521/g.16628 Transcript_16521/m.16628 type:complete len:257 (+) Transcript_16521:62-832(+)
MKMTSFLLWETAKYSSVEVLWDLLGREISLIFGRDCASATIWMFCCLIFRWVTLLTHFDYIPLGVIFALPYFIQQISRRVPIIADTNPLLPVRIAEIILGRLSPTSFAVVAPAHFLGCILGGVIFMSVLPFAAKDTLTAISYAPANTLHLFGLESILVAIYVVVTIALPEILSVNKLSPNISSVIILPIMMIPTPNYGVMFHPAALYTLSYLHGKEAWSLGYSQAVHLVSPVMGAILGGWICLRMFPDDPTTWRRK